MKKIALFFIAVLTYFNSSAQITRKLESFNSIKVASAFKVELVKGNDNEVEIIGVPEQFLENVVTEVRNNRLSIYAKNRIKADAEMKIIVTFIDLEEINISGAATIRNNTPIMFNKMNIKSSGASTIKLDADFTDLIIDVSGSSDLKLKGNATSYNLKGSGASSIKNGELFSETVEIDLSGASTAIVYVTKNISGEVSGASDLKIVGNPESSNIQKSGAADVKGVKVSFKTTNNYENTINESDTTRFKWKNNTFLIIGDTDSISKKQKLRYNHWAGFDLGINGFLNSSGSADLSNTPETFQNTPQDVTQFMELRLQKSWSVNLNFYEQYIPISKHHVGLVMGLGFEWNNYELRHNVRLTSKGGEYVFDNVNDFNKNYTWGEIDTLRDYSKNRFKTFFINAPLLFELNSGNNKNKSFHISTGAIFGFNLQTKMKYKYKVEGDSKKEKDKQDFNTNPFRVSLTARVGYGRFNVFASYSLTPLFENNKGPELYPFSVGVTLVSF
ncbi:MAG: DUF2807 domain-containing protein [Vicingaceae bacterium]|nr:DUF2807 domain-containing protein [Vicingaceae bacterium]